MHKIIFIFASSAESLRNFRGSFIIELIRQGYVVHVGAPYLSTAFDEERWLKEQGAVCHDVPMSRTGVNPLADLAFFNRLRKKITEVKPDIFFGYTIKPVIWGTLAAAFCRVPYRVALITGLGYAFTGKVKGKRKLVKLVAKFLYRVALKRAHLVFFQNPDDRVDFERLGILHLDTPTTIINGSGVDTEQFSYLPVQPGTVRFLLIARLLADKGIREYAEAAKLIRQQYKNVEFCLVGGVDTNPDGLREEEVREWAKNGYLNWSGHQSDVRPFINRCSVYVLPSYREGTPRTVLEAMSVGRAIITTDAPGCRETVSDGDNGFLVDVQSVHQLVSAMKKFIEQPELIESMGVRSRHIAVEKYDVNKVNKSMLDAMKAG